MEWISVEDRLPKYGEVVCLMDVRSYANSTIDVTNEHIIKAGYRNKFRLDYWSIHDERSVELDSFTHWHPLQDPPKEAKCPTDPK